MLAIICQPMVFTTQPPAMSRTERELRGLADLAVLRVLISSSNK
jgi:hypothetical protein